MAQKIFRLKSGVSNARSAMSERVVWFSIRRPFRHVLGLGLYLMYGDDRSVGMILLLGPWALVLGPHHTGEGAPHAD